MRTKKLTVAEIQIFFDESGAARFDARGRQRAAVELELSQHRDFIDRWLELSEEPPHQRRLTQEDQQLRRVLKRIVKELKHHFDKDFITVVLLDAAKRLNEAGGLAVIQVEESVADAISTL